MAKDDDALAAAFLAKLKLSPDVLKTSKYLLTEALSQYLTERRKGNKAEAAKLLKHFIDEIMVQTGAEKPVLAKLQSAVESWGKKNARFTYMSAFKKRAGDMKKLLSTSKSKGGKAGAQASQRLHRDMLSSGELPANTKYEDFEKELRTAFKGKLPSFNDADDAKSKKKISKPDAKAVRSIKWAGVMRKFSLPKTVTIQLEDLGMQIWKTGPKDAKAKKLAQQILKDAGNAKKGEDDKLVNAVYDEVAGVMV